MYFVTTMRCCFLDNTTANEVFAYSFAIAYSFALVNGPAKNI